MKQKMFGRQKEILLHSDSRGDGRCASFFKSFVYAWNGILHGITTERNLKFHVTAAIVVVLIAGILTGLSVIRMVHDLHLNRRDARVGNDECGN